MPQAVVRSEHGKWNYADVWSLHVGVALRRRGTVDVRRKMAICDRRHPANRGPTVFGKPFEMDLFGLCNAQFLEESNRGSIEEGGRHHAGLVGSRN